MTPGGPLNPRPAGDGGSWVVFYAVAAIFIYAVLFGVAFLILAVL